MTIDEMIAVLQAAKAGKQIQHQGVDGKWYNCIGPTWSFDRCAYRVKPEPREGWINVYPSGFGFTLYKSLDDANAGRGNGRIECIHVREVLE